MTKLNWLDWLALVLVIIGGLNWGLIAFGWNWNLVQIVLGTGVAATVVYGLVGLSAIYTIFLVAKISKSAKV